MKERDMKADRQVKALLLAIAVFLALIALRPYVTPATARADSSAGYPVFVEPGVSMLRAPDGTKQVFGKVVVDLRNGNVWGFPTLQQDPYPSSGTSAKVQTSHPFLLGTYALADMDR
jgi:hypothetical protein